MITKKIGEKTYNIPSTWMDVTLDKFLRIKQLEDNIDKIDFVDYALEYISAMTNIPTEVLDNLPADELGQLSRTIEGIISTKVNSVTENGFKLNEKYYIFDGKTDKMILGQFIDAEMLSDSADIWTNAHKIAAVFWREMEGKPTWYEKATGKVNFKKHKPEKYDSEKCLENSRSFMMELPMPYIYHTVFFFKILSKQYQQFTARSLKKKSSMITDKKLPANGLITKRGGTGTPLSTTSQMGI